MLNLPKCHNTKFFLVSIPIFSNEAKFNGFKREDILIVDKIFLGMKCEVNVNFLLY
jgi:hypothetical protein